LAGERLVREGGLKLGVEHWDDALPIPPWNQGVEHIELPLYEWDSRAKWKKMIDKLEDAEAIVLASNRLIDPLKRVGKNARRYRITRRYYELLERGDLGFVEMADFHIKPWFWGMEIDTQKADESFQVYDHQPTEYPPPTTEPSA